MTSSEQQQKQTTFCKQTKLLECGIMVFSADGEEELSSRCRPLSLDCTKENIAGCHVVVVFVVDDDHQYDADADNNADVQQI